MAVLTDPRYQALRDISASDLGAGPNIRAAILAQFAAEKAGEWPPQDNNPGNVHVGAMAAAGYPGLPGGVGDNGAVARFPTPDAGAHGYANYIRGYGPARLARAAIVVDDANAYINAVVAFGYGTNETTWRYELSRIVPVSTPPPPIGVEVTPEQAWSPLYVAASRLADVIGATRPDPPWAASQSLTAGHFGSPPSHADAVNYLSQFLYRIALYAKQYWKGGNREAVVARPASVPAGATDPTTIVAPAYVGAVDVGNATSSFIPLPPWFATQHLTPLHLGDPPTIEDGADYVLVIADSVLTAIGGTPAPVLPPPPGTETPPPGGSTGGGGSGGFGTSPYYIPPPPGTQGGAADPFAGAHAFVTGPKLVGSAGTIKVWGDFTTFVNHTMPQLGASMVAAALRAAGR